MKKLPSKILPAMKPICILFMVFLAFFSFIYQPSIKKVGATFNFSSFTDVPDNHWAFWYIEAVGQKNIIRGYPDNTFKPDTLVSKDIGVAFVVRAAGIKPCCTATVGEDCQSSSACNTPYFSDVPQSSWAYPYVQAAFISGILNGTFSGTNFYTAGDSAERLTQGTLLTWIYNISHENGIPPSFPSYSASSQTTRAQAAALIAWNLNIPPKLQGQSTKIVLNEDGEPVDTKEPLSGAIIEIWNNATSAAADNVTRADENGYFSYDLDIKKVTSNLKVESNDPEKYFPPISLAQQSASASRRRSSVNRAIASGIKSWGLDHTKKSDCGTTLNDRITQVSGVEKTRWINYWAQLDRAHSDWDDEKITYEVAVAIRKYYTGGINFCCTGFATWVLTKAGLVDKNNRSFFYSLKTTLPQQDARIVGAKALREWFTANNNKKLVARDGNIYKVVFHPRKEIFSDASILKPGQVFMKLPPQGVNYSGHSAIFYPTVDSINSANTMNCDGSGDFIEEMQRNLTDDSHGAFFGSGGFECSAN